MQLFLSSLFCIVIFWSCNVSTSEVENKNLEAKTDTQAINTPSEVSIQPPIQQKKIELLSDTDTELDRLKKSYKNLSNFPGVKSYEKEYFDAFPKTFASFNYLLDFFYETSIKEYDSSFQPLLCEESIAYIDAFLKLRHIDTIQYYNKIIDITYKGEWEADVVGYFHNGMMHKVDSNLNLFCKLLSQRSEEEIRCFWWFYFDGPHPVSKLPVHLKVIKKIDAKIFDLMTTTLSAVQKLREEEHH